MYKDKEKHRDVIWQCPYSPVYCYSLKDCNDCFNYMNLELYGIKRIMEKLQEV